MSRLIHMGQRLKQILKQKKVKIVDFADMAGFTNQIAHYHLRKSDMKRSTLEKFCEIIGVTPEEFYEWNSTPSVNGEKGTDSTILHHGGRLMELIGERGLNKTRLAKRLGMSRRTMYNLFEKEVFGAEELDRVVRALEMTTTSFLHPGALEDARQAENDEMLALREKYYKLLEEHNMLLKSYSSIKEGLELAKKDILQLRKQARSKKG
ncbi:helix-turn-helix transcriptional regulator [Chitinophaga pinensis]|uniref:Transcriptional regulator, XRE family n=1 Tax=Chitinophaga pinensis (strain ATCC 43595 / DSM 2588 / LMG 13176 / NBRC 15968 / NCIMB 11800 / UQM 2034) TaxID=485918 RepID=A0A979GMH4_CHIPD|nr:helix-turn-helix transcriptional regulator [Chitinophaga pinensis]ACU58417.1 transcriptional regulator, XRE family [Chitinophaga pinensis DSM 2588]